MEQMYQIIEMPAIRAVAEKLMQNVAIVASASTDVSDLTAALLPAYKAIFGSIITEVNADSSATDTRVRPQASSSISVEEAFEVWKEHNSSSRSVATQCPTDKDETLYTKQLLAIMHNEEYISGEIAPSEDFVRQIISERGMKRVLDWLKQVYRDNFHKPSVLIGLLHMISHFSYEEVAEDGPIMALALLQHSSFSVREFAIKAFENWDSKESLAYLKNIRCDQRRLQDYLNEVICFIERKER